MTEKSTLIMGLAGVTSWGVTLLLLAAFIVVVLVTVRPRRPDVAPMFLLALSLDVLFTLAGFAAQFLLPQLVSRGLDMSHYAEAQALSTMTLTLGHGISRVLIIWGVARLASPVRP